MVVGYHHFRKHPNPFWFALSSLCRLPISLWFFQTAFGVGDTVTPTNTSSKDKFLIFKEGEVKSLTEGCASGWLGMKSGMKHEAVEMYGGVPKHLFTACHQKKARDSHLVCVCFPNGSWIHLIKAVISCQPKFSWSQLTKSGYICSTTILRQGYQCSCCTTKV